MSKISTLRSEIPSPNVFMWRLQIFVQKLLWSIAIPVLFKICHEPIR